MPINNSCSLTNWFWLSCLLAFVCLNYRTWGFYLALSKCDHYYGMMWCDMMWCKFNVMWYYIVRYGMTWHGMAWHGMAWHCIALHCIALYFISWPTFTLLSLPLYLECYNRPWSHSREAYDNNYYCIVLYCILFYFILLYFMTYFYAPISTIVSGVL